MVATGAFNLIVAGVVLAALGVWSIASRHREGERWRQLESRMGIDDPDERARRGQQGALLRGVALLIAAAVCIGISFSL